MNFIAGLLGSLVKPVTSIFKSKIEAKKAHQSANDKIKAARVTGQQQIEMSDAEWEQVDLKTQLHSWKDEYATIIGTLPYLLVVVGAVFAAFGDPKLMTGALDGIKQLNDMGVPVGKITYMVILAAVGLKLWRQA